MKVHIKSKVFSTHCFFANFQFLYWTGEEICKWVANDDNYGICRMPFDSCFPDCKLPGDDCPLVWGQCTLLSHA